MNDSSTLISKENLSSFLSVLPFLVFADNMQKGLVFSLVFVFALSSAGLTSILLPQSIDKNNRFWLSCFAAAAASSIAASTLRLLDPLLYESCYTRIFLASITVPVLKMSVPLKNSYETEKYIEKILLALAYGLLILIFGVFREFLAYCSLSTDSTLPKIMVFPMAGEASGAFILLGLAAAFVKAVFLKNKRINP